MTQLANEFNSFFVPERTRSIRTYIDGENQYWEKNLSVNSLCLHVGWLKKALSTYIDMDICMLTRRVWPTWRNEALQSQLKGRAL